MKYVKKGFLYMANLKRDLTILLHMQGYCEEVEETLNTFNKDIEQFKNNFIFRNAISMSIFQIGELANHLSKDYLNETKNEINWYEIIGMRNRFAHGYFDMDYQIIFETALKDIPVLAKFINEEIDRLNV